MTAIMDNDHKSAQPEDNVWGRFAETTSEDFGGDQLSPDTQVTVFLYASPEYYPSQSKKSGWKRFLSKFVSPKKTQNPAEEDDIPYCYSVYASPEYYASRDQDSSLEGFDWESLPPSDEAPNAAMQQTGCYPSSWLEPDAPAGDVPMNGDVYASPRFHEDKEAGNQKGARAFKDDWHPDGPDSMNEDTRP